MRKNMSRALAVSLSIALAAGNTPIGTSYVSAQESPVNWEVQAEGESSTSKKESTDSTTGAKTEESTEGTSTEKQENTSEASTEENKKEDTTTESAPETSTTEGTEESGTTETQPEETEKPDESGTTEEAPEESGTTEIQPEKPEEPEQEPVVSLTQEDVTTNYSDFTEAWDEASISGGTLTLCQNIEVPEPLESTADITLNLNGYELSGSVEVTMDTLRVIDESETGEGLLSVQEGTTVTVSGGTLEVHGAKISGADSAINVLSGTLKTARSQISGTDAAINVYDGEVNIDKDTSILAEGNAVNLITPYNETANSMNLTVSGGNISSKEGAAVREYFDTSESTEGEDISWHTNISNITIKDGTFSGKEKALDFSDSLVKEENILNITGGTFSSDVKSYLSSAYTTNKTEDGQYIVTARENPVKADLQYELKDITYDGKAHTINVTSKKSMGEITVLYNGKEEIPVNAGTYNVSVKVAESNNYFAGEFDLGNFQIKKADTATTLTVALTQEREHVEENTIGYFGDEVTMTASVSGIEGEILSGNIVFYDGETELKTVPLEENKAQLKTSELTAQSHEITAKYLPSEETNYKESVSTKVAANIAEVKETGIEVTTQPMKTAYTDTESFNPEGMVVTAHYNNGSTKEVEDYVVDTEKKLTVDTTEVQITHENDYTASVPVTVTHDTNYRYEKNEIGNTLTKKCGGCEEVFGTVSIAAPETLELDRENGNPAVLTTTGDIASSDVSVTYVATTGGEPSSLAPTKAGTYIATATYNEQTITTTFTLIISVTGVTANEVYALKVGDSANLSKTIAPEDATNQEVVWESDNNQIVTVDEAGKITAVAEGEATVTVTTKDQNKTASCKIYVMPQDSKFGKCGDNAWWKFNDGVFTVWGKGAVTETGNFSAYKGKTTSVVVEKGITEIKGFNNFSSLTEVSLSEGLEKVRNYAFNGCSNLRRIELPESVTEVSSDAFTGCTGVNYLKIMSPKCSYATTWRGLSFTGLGTGEEVKEEGYTLEFGEKVKEIPNIVPGTGLKHVKFDGEVEVIGNNAFNGCSNLEEINLPDSVREIGEHTFEGCEKLGSIRFGSHVEKIGYSAFKDVKGLKEIEIPSSVKEIGGDAFRGCSSLQQVGINAQLNAGTEGSAFVEAGTEELRVVYGTGVTSIGRLFSGSSVRSVKFPEGLEKVGNYAFNGCSNLRRIELPESVTEVSSDAFTGCTGVNYLKIMSPKCSYATTWRGLSFTGLGTGEEVKEEGYTLEFGEKVKEIPNIVPGTGLKHVKFDGEVEVIGNNAFNGCSNLEEINLPDSVKEIRSHAFEGCSKLSTITLGSNIATIGYGAFYGLTNLTSVTLPSKLKDIAGNAFANCKNLKEYIVSDGNSDLSAKDGVLYGKDETELISYPAGKDNQTEFDMLSMNIDTIREGAFEGNTALKAIKIGDDVQTIGEDAFANVSDNLKLYVYKNSYADEYAKENEVPVQYIQEEAEAGVPVFRGASLSLAGTILINYYVEFPEDVKEGRVDFDLVDDSGKTKSKVSATLNDATKETIKIGNTSYQCYHYSVSLNAKQMTDKILAKAYATTADNKEVATRKFYYSVEKYVSNKMKNTSTNDSLKNVLAAMMDYGTAAQNYFEYNTQHLANKILSDTNVITEEDKQKLVNTLEGYQKTKEQMQQYARTITPIDNPTTSVYGIALDLRSTVSIRVIVPKNTTSVNDKLAYTVGNEATVHYLKLQDYNSTYYYADITGIVAKSLDAMYHIYVSDASGNQISNTANYGVMSYALQKWDDTNENLAELVKKLQVYNVASQKYFQDN